MRLSSVVPFLAAAGLVAATPAPTPVSDSASAEQTFTAPASLMPSEVADLINGGQSMYVTKTSGLLSETKVIFGDYDASTNNLSPLSTYTVPFSLLPPQLVTSLLGDFDLLIQEGPTDLIQIITGIVTGQESVSKMKRQVPITGPIGNFLAQLIGYLPVNALPGSEHGST